MKNNITSKFSADEIITLATGALFILLGLYDAIFESNISGGTITLLVIGGIQVAGVIFFNHLTAGSINKIESNICECLKEQGFKHEKKDGTLYVIKNDNRFRVQLSDGVNSRIKQLIVMYNFGDDNFDKVSKDGWNRVANSINLNNGSITFVTLEDHFCCCYQSAISNAKDFMNEFNQAYLAIGGALEDYRKIYPYIERDYPNTARENKSGIGFK